MYCVVEGHGDPESVAILIRRVAAQERLAVPNPIRHSRVPRTTLVRAGEFERVLEFARIRTGPAGRVLVLIDADDDCPRDLAQSLLDRAGARTDLDVSVVIANREFESWFLAGAASLRGKRGLAEDLTRPADPESIRGAKEWLSGHMVGGHPYSPPVDQPALTAVVDLDECRGVPSFDKCYREIVRLLRPT